MGYSFLKHIQIVVIICWRTIASAWFMLYFKSSVDAFLIDAIHKLFKWQEENQQNSPQIYYLIKIPIIIASFPIKQQQNII